MCAYIVRVSFDTQGNTSLSEVSIERLGFSEQIRSCKCFLQLRISIINDLKCQFKVSF